MSEIGPQVNIHSEAMAKTNKVLAFTGNGEKMICNIELVSYQHRGSFQATHTLALFNTFFLFFFFYRVYVYVGV